MPLPFIILLRGGRDNAEAYFMDSRRKDRGRGQRCQYGGATGARYEGGLSVAGGEESLHFTGIWVNGNSKQAKGREEIIEQEV